MHLLPQRIHLESIARASFILGVSPIRAGHMLQSNFASLFSQRHRITLYLGERVGHYVDMPASASATGGTVQHRDSI